VSSTDAGLDTHVSSEYSHSISFTSHTNLNTLGLEYEY